MAKPLMSYNHGVLAQPFGLAGKVLMALSVPRLVAFTSSDGSRHEYRVRCPCAAEWTRTFCFLVNSHLKAFGSATALDGFKVRATTPPQLCVFFRHVTQRGTPFRPLRSTA